jgi:hypothetical protein
MVEVATMQQLILKGKCVLFCHLFLEWTLNRDFVMSRVMVVSRDVRHVTMGLIDIYFLFSLNRVSPRFTFTSYFDFLFLLLFFLTPICNT